MQYYLQLCWHFPCLMQLLFTLQGEACHCRLNCKWFISLVLYTFEIIKIIKLLVDAANLQRLQMRKIIVRKNVLHLCLSNWNAISKSCFVKHCRTVAKEASTVFIATFISWNSRIIWNTREIISLISILYWQSPFT